MNTKFLAIPAVLLTFSTGQSLQAGTPYQECVSALGWSDSEIAEYCAGQYNGTSDIGNRVQQRACLIDITVLRNLMTQCHSVKSCEKIDADLKALYNLAERDLNASNCLSERNTEACKVGQKKFLANFKYAIEHTIECD